MPQREPLFEGANFLNGFNDVFGNIPADTFSDSISIHAGRHAAVMETERVVPFMNTKAM